MVGLLHGWCSIEIPMTAIEGNFPVGFRILDDFGIRRFEQGFVVFAGAVPRERQFAEKDVLIDECKGRTPKVAELFQAGSEVAAFVQAPCTPMTPSRSLHNR